MNDRCWRALAIAWFDAMEREIGRHFVRSFMSELHRVINLGTEKELHDLRYSCELRRKQVDEIVQTPKEERLIDGAWWFHLLCETFFVALCDLVLEDFRYEAKEFIVHFWRTSDDDKPYESVVVSATENRIVDVANRMVVERGDHSMSYEEKT